MAAFDHVALYLHIIIGKFGRFCIISVDPPHFCRCQHDHIRPFLFKKVPDSRLFQKIQFLMRPANNIRIAFGFQAPYDRAANQPSVSRYINLIRLIHSCNLAPFAKNLF